MHDAFGIIWLELKCKHCNHHIKYQHGQGMVATWEMLRHETGHLTELRAANPPPPEPPKPDGYYKSDSEYTNSIIQTVEEKLGRSVNEGEVEALKIAIELVTEDYY